MSKTLFLIRHAESTNNVDKREARRAWRKLPWELPTKAQLLCCLRLLKVDMNSPLSPHGIQQVKELQHRLAEENFLQANEITQILCSPLLRATQTCSGIFSTTFAIHPETYEKCLMEYLLPHRFKARVRRFALELATQTDQHTTICIVAHSAFFRQLTATTQNLKNCQVVKCTLLQDGRIV